MFVWSSSLKINREEKQICSQNLTQICILLLFFFIASQWFQVNHFVLTHPVTKSTSEVNRMHVPIEAQQHAMLFAIRKPRQDDRSCRQNSFVSCVDLCCVSNMQYYSGRKFHSFFSFFFVHSLSICLSVFFSG